MRGKREREGRKEGGREGSGAEGRGEERRGRETLFLPGVPLHRCGLLLALEVPGLAEGRPSVLMGDRVVVCVTEGGWRREGEEGEEEEEEREKYWEGCVHEVS